jgi:hypothetical protein
MDADQFERLHRLSEIFMPEFTRRRREAYRRQTGEEPRPGAILRFAHYTSASAAMSIIAEKRIWMRNTNCMTDYSEIQHGYRELLKSFNTENPDRQKFLSAIEACSPGAATQAITHFDTWFNDTRLNTFITSMSEHMVSKEDASEDLYGRLSMWRAFGGSAARVAMIFKIPYQSPAGAALNIIFSPVSYLTEGEIQNVFREVIENVNKEQEFLRSVSQQEIVATIFIMLISAVTCLKHKGFHEEREWRVVYAPIRQSSSFVTQITREVAGIPQPIYQLPLDKSVSPIFKDLDLPNMFDRLIIGPSPYPWPIYQAFVDVLTRAGVPSAGERVWSSNIPIRA